MNLRREAQLFLIIGMNKLENQCTRRAQLVAYDEGKNTIFVYCDIFYVHVYTTIFTMMISFWIIS